MLRTWAFALVIAVLAMASGQPGAGEKPAMFCLTAGELGLTGSPPDLMASVFERGRWRPAQIYVEPEEVLFVPAPLLNGTTADAVAKVAEKGFLPPPRLRNNTKICVEAAPGAPGRKPPGGGVLYMLRDERGGVYHIFIASPRDVEDYINFSMAVAAVASAPKARVVEARRYEHGRPEVSPLFSYPLNQPVSMNYLAAFKSRYMNYTYLGPRSCTSAVIDLPAETYQLILTFNTPGVYSYTIYRNGVYVTSGGVAVGSSEVLVPIAGTSGRATYRIVICNQDVVSATLDVTFLVDVRGQANIPRVDVVSTPRTGIRIEQGNPQIASTTPAYIYLPGYALEAVETRYGAYVLVEARLHKRAAPSGVLYVYWGGLYVGSLTGTLQPDGYYYFRGTLPLSEGLVARLLPTFGRGGSIMLGPVDLGSLTSGQVAVDVLIHRPLDLAPAGDALYYWWAIPRFKYVFNMHAIEYVQALVGGFYRGASYRVELTLQTAQRPVLVVTSVGRYNWEHVVDLDRDFEYKFFISMVDGNGNALSYVTSPACTDFYKKGPSGILAELIRYISTALSWSDLVKQTIDWLKRVATGVPVVGYVTLLLEDQVERIGGGCGAEASGNVAILSVRPGHNVPSSAVFMLSAPSNVVFYVSRAEVWDHSGISPFLRQRADLGSTPIVGIPYGPPGQPRGTEAYFSDSNVIFPYRTLTCGFQHGAPIGISDPSIFATCRNADFR